MKPILRLNFVACLTVLYIILDSHGVDSATNKNVLVILGDDVGFEMNVYGNKVCKTPNIELLAQRSLVFDNGFTSVSSCSPSRSTVLTGLPQHQNGMFGLENDVHHFQSFANVKSVSKLLHSHDILTGIIGKKHVAPESVYPFDFSRTELDGHSILQVGRNITFIKELVKEFLTLADERPFFLYVAFHDAHRCGHTHPQYGSFCEKFGDADIPGMGDIPDWKPVHYEPSEVDVPYFIQHTPISRLDIAAQYKTMSRFDQEMSAAGNIPTLLSILNNKSPRKTRNTPSITKSLRLHLSENYLRVGLVLRELQQARVLDDTLIIFASDNGISFPSGRTNLYDPGMREPFMISNPYQHDTWGKRTNARVSLLNIVPTILDWFNVTYPSYSIFKHGPVTRLSEQSLLPLTQKSLSEDQFDTVYASHSLHEVTMYYPMRVIRTSQYKLIHNINYLMPFPIDEDFYLSPTFQDILNRTRLGKPLPWYKTLRKYYYREQWELFDIQSDPMEKINLSHNLTYANVMQHLQKTLNKWQNVTADPWICAPWGVLEDKGAYKSNPSCLPLYNDLRTEM